MMNNIGIYVHIPFCEHKCIYCDFASFVSNADIKERYFNSLISEIKTCEIKKEVSSIYFGGGTPSVVDEKFIGEVFATIKKNFLIKKDAEITIECNPNSATFDKLNFYKQVGFNRISFGVQSLHDDMLKKIGRVHNSQQVLNAIDNAKKVGFENISVDLLIGLPGQKKEDLIDDSKILIDKKITHISAYMLQVEEKTPLFKLVNDGKMILPDDDICVDFYTELSKFLKTRGFERYEISNFALPYYESKHNCNYWKVGEYIGFGLSAHSFIDGKRIANSRKMDEYLNRENITVEELDDKEKIAEKIMLGLRCKFGVSISDLKKLGYYITKNFNYKNFIDKKIIIENGDTFYLNPDFYGVSNTIICDLIPE